MYHNTKIVFIILIVSLVTSCNSVKRLSDNEYLLKKNQVVVNNKKISDLEVLSYINQRPNQSFLNLPISLYVFNWAKPNFEETSEKWRLSHPNNTKFIQTLFSDKQVDEVYTFNKKMNKLIKKNGEAPVIIDSVKTRKSVNTLKEYYKQKGFFDAQVDSKEIVLGNKKKEIQYHVTTNSSYKIDSLYAEIESPELKKIYDASINNSFIKSKTPYNRANLIKEQNRLTTLFRNSGIYYFGKNYIRFEVIENDTTKKERDVKLIISNRVIEQGENRYTTPFKIRKVSKINVFTDYSFKNKGKEPQDSIYYEGYTFYAYNKLEFNPKRLANNIAIQPNGVFKDDEQKQTIQYLNDINLFRSPINIRYSENKDGNLIATIYLIPLKKYGVDVSAEATHSNIKPFGVLGKFGVIDRNIFRGSEIFKFSIQGSFLNVAEDTSSPDFNFFGLTAWEIGANTSFNIPRIFFPINMHKLIPKRMRPMTNIGVSLSYQKNIGLDRQNITGNITYNWRKGKKIKHQFELLNVQYINNSNASNYFSVFNSDLRKLSDVSQRIIDPITNTAGEINNADDYINYVLNPTNNYVNTDFDDFKTVQRVKERKDIITEDVLVPAMTYQFTYNGKTNLNDTKFSFFNARIAEVGSLASAITQESNNGKKELFGLPIAQYIKTELEYKKYWHLYNNNNLVFRTFIGAAVPFGNSTEIPFSRSYRAGGSNDIRAWKTFDLGPGATLSNLDFNIGNLKLVSNFEYRFKIVNSFYSALFVDAGNVWDLTNSDLTNTNAKFKGFNSLKEIAVGSGFGIRYDLTFLIFRTDFGFKTYEPYLTENRWFRNYNFKHAVFNFGINYPF